MEMTSPNGSTGITGITEKKGLYHIKWVLWVLQVLQVLRVFKKPKISQYIEPYLLWCHHLNWLQIWPPDGATRIDYKFSRQVALLASLHFGH